MIVKVVQMRAGDVQDETESATAAFTVEEHTNETGLMAEVTVERTHEDALRVVVQGFALDYEGDWIGFDKDAVTIELTRDKIMDAG